MCFRRLKDHSELAGTINCGPEDDSESSSTQKQTLVPCNHKTVDNDLDNHQVSVPRTASGMMLGVLHVCMSAWKPCVCGYLCIFMFVIFVSDREFFS